MKLKICSVLLKFQCMVTATMKIYAFSSYTVCYRVFYNLFGNKPSVSLPSILILFKCVLFSTRTIPHHPDILSRCLFNFNMLFTCIYRVSQEEGTKLRESVPYVKIYRYNPKHLYPKLNGYGDNGQRSLKLWQLLHTY